MPRKVAEMSALAVKRLMAPGLFAVGGVSGLCLQVQSSGARSWIMRMTMPGGRRREMGLGGYPDISLAMARELAHRAREQAALGRDPVAERQAARREQQRALTFGEAARQWHAVKAQEYRNAKHAAQVLTTLETYAGPIIGAKPVAEIDIRDVLAVLEPIWKTKTETADRVRGRIENVLAWAGAAGYRSGENPARWRGNLDVLLPRPGKLTAVRHHAAMPIDDLPEFFGRLHGNAGIGARALEFLILTAARSGEVRLAVWAEIDVAQAIWTIPAERMKAGREHRVPLGAAAAALLAALPRRPDSPWIFCGARGGPLSDMTISAVTRRMGVAAVPHGFRSAFRDWAAERTSHPSEVAEMALAHSIANKVEAAYRRGDLLDKRRALMADWERFVTSATQSFPQRS